MANGSGSPDPRVIAAWRRMLWVMRGSADVVEALAPIAAGMTKDEISRLLARAGAPSGKGVEPVEQVLALLGLVPRSRYEALLAEQEELTGRVEEAEQRIEHLRRAMREKGLVDEADQLIDGLGGLVRRMQRAQADFVRSVRGGNGAVPEPPASIAEAGKDPAPAAVDPATDDGDDRPASGRTRTGTARAAAARAKRPPAEKAAGRTGAKSRPGSGTSPRSRRSD